MTDNELIAEFMGGRKQIIGDDQLHGYSPGTILWHGLFDEHGHTTYLSFDDDWEWLMPVVEKIETMYDTGIFYDGHRQPDVHNIRIYAKRGGSETIVVSYGTSKIETTYKAVVEFIKWYNSQK